MKTRSNTSCVSGWLRCLFALALMCPLAAHAYPPAPHHTFYGMVRDEYGNPINTPQAEVILETSAGVTIKAEIVAGLEPGINYRLEVPMDAGITSDLYKPTALRPTVPFKIKVKIGQTTYLPIEMVGDFASMGQPGQRTLLNLTVGEDSDGDGIPDAWERALLALLGPGKGLQDVRAGDDFDGDGLTNLEEYLAGTYAFDPKDGFDLKIVRLNGDVPVLEFLAIRGRTYTVHASADLKTWEPVDHRVSADGPDAQLRRNYESSDVRKLQVEVPHPSGQPAVRFFRVMVE